MAKGNALLIQRLLFNPDDLGTKKVFRIKLFRIFDKAEKHGKKQKMKKIRIIINFIEKHRKAF